MMNPNYWHPMPLVGTRTGAARRLRPDGGADRSDTVLVPLVDGRAADRVIELGVDVAADRDDGVLVVLAVAKPGLPPGDRTLAKAESERELGRRVRRAKQYGGASVTVEGELRMGRRRDAMVTDAAARRDVDVLVIERPRDASRAGGLLRSTVDVVVDEAGCDVVVASRPDRIDALASILVAVAGGPHSGLAIDVGRAIAGAHDGWLDVFHVVEDGPDGDATPEPARVVEAAEDRLGGFERADTWLHDADDAADAIIEQSRYYDMTIVGEPRKGRLREFVYGSTTASVERAVDVPVLVVRRSDARRSWTERWLAKGT